MAEFGSLEIAGSALAAISVLPTLIEALKAKGLLSSSDVDAI